MKHFKIVTNIFLSSLLISACTEYLNEDPGIGQYQARLNPTEQKLKGDWYLRTMSTKDSVYTDSIVNRQRTIHFDDIAHRNVPQPRFNDKTDFYKRLTPNSTVVPDIHATWIAPNPYTLKINYYITYERVTISLGIEKLEPNKLILVDDSTGTIWKFER